MHITAKGREVPGVAANSTTASDMLASSVQAFGGVNPRRLAMLRTRPLTASRSAGGTLGKRRAAEARSSWSWMTKSFFAGQPKADSGSLSRSVLLSWDILGSSSPGKRTRKGSVQGKVRTNDNTPSPGSLPVARGVRSRLFAGLHAPAAPILACYYRLLNRKRQQPGGGPSPSSWLFFLSLGNSLVTLGRQGDKICYPGFPESLGRTHGEGPCSTARYSLARCQNSDALSSRASAIVSSGWAGHCPRG
jgi:hypothetical protein